MVSGNPAGLNPPCFSGSGRSAGDRRWESAARIYIPAGRMRTFPGTKSHPDRFLPLHTEQNSSDHGRERPFDGRSSQKNLHGMENQLVIDDGIITSITDQSCYTLDNVADYLYGIFDGRDDVKLEELWEALAVHPVFPSDGFKKEIKGILKSKYQVVFTKSRVSFYAGDNK